jgi:hypothetical protein
VGFFTQTDPYPRWVCCGPNGEVLKLRFYPLPDATVRVLAHRFLKNGRYRPTLQVYI